MARIVFETEIHAAPAVIIDALTTKKGIESWWTDDVALEGGVGSTMTLGFAVAPVPFELRIDAIDEQVVVWRSVGSFPPHWVDTTVTWTVTEAGADASKVHFNHDGWADDEGAFPMSAYTWGQLVGRLADYARDGTVAPLFTKDMAA